MIFENNIWVGVTGVKTGENPRGVGIVAPIDGTRQLEERSRYNDPPIRTDHSHRRASHFLVVMVPAPLTKLRRSNPVVVTSSCLLYLFWDTLLLEISVSSWRHHLYFKKLSLIFFVKDNFVHVRSSSFITWTSMETRRPLDTRCPHFWRRRLWVSP